MSKFALLFASVYFSGLFMSLFKGAHWAFYIYQLVYFLNPEKRWWSAGLPFSRYSLITVAVLFFAYMMQRKKFNYHLNEIRKLPQFKWIIMLLITYGLVYFSAVSKGLHYEAMIEYIKLFIVIGIAYKVVDTRKKLEYSIHAMIVGIAYLGFVTYSMGRDEFGRIGRFGMIDAPDANVAAAAMIASLPFLIFYFWRGSLKTKIIMTIFGAIIVNGLVLANSRGAFVGGGIACVYFVWEMLRSKFKVRFQRIITVFLIACGLVSLTIVIDTSFLERMSTLSDVSDGRKSGSNRVTFWVLTFDVLKEYPFGAGASGYELLSPNYVPAEYFDRGKSVKAVHSIWFQALAEVSYIGFFFFMMIIYTTYRSLQKVRRYYWEKKDVYGYYFTHAILSSYIGVLVASSFINQFRTQIVYWLILFTACLFNIVMLRKKDNS
ncbi:MAG: hypothetical protein COA54_00615 [Thiotrichaceae bacterium]|nr:MAG: hypothetical protein COA54_00615 [Thiotrichaceae bacterium]